MFRYPVIFIVFVITSSRIEMSGQTDQSEVEHIDDRTAFYANIASQIWEFAEVGYQEHRSSALLQQTLKEGGFKITSGVAGMPTAFTAEYGSGKPVIAILGEFDALPGLSQHATPEK